ncbi:dihydrofolate reductase family protein [Streptomyces sp. NA04227]|uniref:RibD family protein n=1 Tax=Streptomyces sp. NA04227 TaxID=2742136 RepID=UPI0015910FD1|nr:dihydrofolate reductase family protein [Streptomyces sp. NA04227]QKW08929.1 dihydrofolate reductase family protein [Streptomyces sp. NA04227]
MAEPPKAATVRRPYVLLSAAVSVDGRLDDTARERLVLSNRRDLDRIDGERAAADAILVGARTLRRDNPRLLVTSPELRAGRVALGRTEHPLKVTVSGSAELDPGLRFWHSGGEKLVFTVDGALPRACRDLSPLAGVVSTGPTLDWGYLLDHLGRHGVERLLVEGGGTVHTQLLAQNLADELHLVVAPLLVGEDQAPSFLRPARYPGGPTARMKLLEARPIDDVVLLRYAPKDRS